MQCKQTWVKLNSEYSVLRVYLLPTEHLGILTISLYINAVQDAIVVVTLTTHNTSPADNLKESNEKYGSCLLQRYWEASVCRKELKGEHNKFVKY